MAEINKAQATELYNLVGNVINTLEAMDEVTYEAVDGKAYYEDLLNWLQEMYNNSSIGFQNDVAEEDTLSAESIAELAKMLGKFFENNPQSGYSVNEIKAYFDFKGIQLTTDEVNDIWNYYTEITSKE